MFLFTASWRPLTVAFTQSSLNADALSAYLEEGQRRAFEAVRRLALETGVAVYLVGGPVRDALLGAPVLDLDLAVEGDAPALARQLSEGLNGRVTIHERFGTATVSAGGGRTDLVTARRESYPSPGRLPLVTPGTINDDLARRDFSVNAMALPLSPSDGFLLDPLGGLGDLRAGVVRTLHRRSFVDDPTRMMRAVRYEQRFGFTIHKSTLDDMSEAVSAGHMDVVSGDRWRQELDRILGEDDPVAPLQRALQLGLMEGIHPAFGEPLMDEDSGLRKVVSLASSEDKTGPDVCFAALFGPLSGADAEGVIHRLRLPERQAALARDTIKLRESEAQIRAASGQPSELARALAGVEPATVSVWAELSSDKAVANALRHYVSDLRFVKPELSGTELLQMGAVEGPEVGRVLGRLRDARLDGTVVSKEEEVSLARDLLARSGVSLMK